MAVRNNLLVIRLQKGYKLQKDFADFLGISQFQYSRYERNENQPSLEVAIHIINKLNIDINEIFYLDN